MTSVLVMNKFLSVFNSIFFFIASEKLGHPVPESNFASLLNNSLPQPAHTYFPVFLLCSNFPVKGSSVLFFLSILYCSGLRHVCHSFSVLGIFLGFIEISHIKNIYRMLKKLYTLVCSHNAFHFLKLSITIFKLPTG